jgi:Uma2 family endonuclease
MQLPGKSQASQLESLLQRHEYLVVIPGATLEEFYALEETKADFLNNTIYMHSPASLAHENLVMEFARQLGNHIKTQGLPYRLYGSNALTEFNPQTRFMPDLTLVREADLHQAATNEFHGVPALVLEILSPGTREHDLLHKRPAYQEAGVSEIWFYDPASHQLTADRKQVEGTYETLVQSSGQYTAQVPEGFQLTLPV